MNRASYFTHDGYETDASHALDNRGILRDGYRMVTPLMMRDSNFTRGVRIVDGSGHSGLALRRPGYRIRTNDAGRRDVEESRFRADRVACNQWRCADGQRVCSDCNGDGIDDNSSHCETCGGDGVVEATRERSSGKGFGGGNEGHRGEDSRSVMRDQVYREYDHALSTAWQSGRTG